MSAEHQGQVEKILKELGQKIDHLIVEAKGAKDEIRDDLEEKIQDLKGKRSDLEDEYNDFKSKNESRWMDIRNHLSSAAEEIKMAAEAAFKKK
ncbi:MAG: hypothetical protein OCD76_15880 [Reichenbachiella sp.]